jgi:uncharacterized membrane protein YphA (DoxX/SURF4 family)
VRCRNNPGKFGHRLQQLRELLAIESGAVDRNEPAVWQLRDGAGWHLLHREEDPRRSGSRGKSNDGHAVHALAGDVLAVVTLSVPSLPSLSLVRKATRSATIELKASRSAVAAANSQSGREPLLRKNEIEDEMTSEFFGGLLLILGLGSRLIGLLLGWSYVCRVLDCKSGSSDVGLLRPGKFYNADPYTFWFAALLVLVFGPGRIALDFLISRRVAHGRAQAANSH